MSEEQLKAFLEKVKTDTSWSFTGKTMLNAAASPEAAIEIAKEACIDF